MKHAVKRIHFIGLGGSGMSGIAEVLHNLGYEISGSDLADSATLRRLAGLGLRTFVGHDAAHLSHVDAVVTSTAVRDDNPEVQAARLAPMRNWARATTSWSRPMSPTRPSSICCR